MTRTAIMIGDMVIGDGATNDEAWQDALAEAKQAGIGISRARLVAYDDATWGVRMLGGIVTLVEVTP